MATFEMTKDFDDIQDPELLPDDWYVLRIVGQPKQMPNNKKKAGLSAEEGARDNIVLSMRVQHANPMWHGRQFTKWLGCPAEGDADRPDYLNSGQSLEDYLLDVQRKWAVPFGGDAAVDGSNVSFEPGDEAQIYIVQELDSRDESGETIINSIPMDAFPRPVE